MLVSHVDEFGVLGFGVLGVSPSCHIYPCSLFIEVCLAFLACYISVLGVLQVFLRGFVLRLFIEDFMEFAANKNSLKLSLRLRFGSSEKPVHHALV